jgi:mannan endo-1,4-beta-mannosidase
MELGESITAGAGLPAGWSGTFSYADGQTAGQTWYATIGRSGASVIARNADRNGRIAAGASSTFGLTPASPGAGTAPDVTRATT